MTAPKDRLSRAAIKAASAAHERDEEIRKAHRDGLSLRAIAGAVGLSHQRVHQIVGGADLVEVEGHPI